MSKASQEKRREKRRKALKAHIITYIIVYGAILLGVTAVWGAFMWTDQLLTAENTVTVTDTVRRVEQYARVTGRRRHMVIQLTLANGQTYERIQSILVGDEEAFATFDELKETLQGKTVTITTWDSMFGGEIDELRVGDTVYYTLAESNQHRAEGRTTWTVFYAIAVLIVLVVGYFNCDMSARNQHILVTSERTRKRRRDRRYRREERRRERILRKEQP